MSTKLWTLSLERSECIGEYKSGGLYNSSDKLIGKFDGKYVYVGINEVVAEIKNGKIYPVESDFLYGVRVTTSIVGEATMGYVYSKSVKMAEYTGDADEAAALAAVLLFGMNDGYLLSDIEKDKTKKTHMREKHRETSSDEDSGSGVGCIMLLIYFVIGFFILACAIVAVMVSVPTFLGVWLLSLLIKFIIRCCKENPEPETEEDKRKFFSIVLWISMILSVGITVIGNTSTSDIIPLILGCGVEIGMFGWAISSVSKGKWKKLFKSSAKKDDITAKGEIKSTGSSLNKTTTIIPKQRKNKIITIILICILLCVIGVNVYLYAVNNNWQKNTDRLAEQYDNDSGIGTQTENAIKGSVEEYGYVISTKLDTNFVLDIADKTTLNGVNLQLWERDSQRAQLFELKKGNDGYYQIINIKSGMALAAEKVENSEYPNVYLENLGASDAQYWRFVDAGEGYYYIVERNSDLFLDVYNAWTENGTNIKLFIRNDAYDAQKWKVSEISTNKNASDLSLTKIIEIESPLQVILSPFWFNDHFIWPNKPENVIHNCIGFSLSIDTTEFINDTNEVLVCVKPHNEEWKFVKTIIIEEASENYELKVMLDKMIELEQFCCFPNKKNTVNSRGMLEPLHLGHADSYYCVSD